MQATLTLPPKPKKAPAPPAQNYQVIEIKRYKLRELAAIYKVSRKTFRGWLDKFRDELGEREGHYYSIAQVKLIFEKLELPSVVRVAVH
jgi:hypothetical protein